MRLEARQFSERESLEHRMLQLETQLGTQQEEETPKPKLIAVTREEQPSKDTTFLQRLENMEKRWEKDLEEQLAKFSSKYDNLTERFFAIEKHVEERNATLIQIMEKLANLPEKPKSAQVKSDENTIDAPKEQANYKSDQETYESEKDSSGKFKKIGKKYYYIENYQYYDYWDAKEKCYELDAILVTPQNEEEWSALKKVLLPAHSYWTSLNDILHENDFKSQTSSDEPPFLIWEESDPQSLPGEEDCVELRADYDHKMNDVDCEKQNYYICEKNKP